MPTITPAPSFMHQLNTALQTSRYDIGSYLKDIDLGTVGLVALVIVLVVFAIDGLAKFFPAYLGTTASYGRSLLTSSAKMWPGIKKDLISEDPRGRGRSLETLTPVLDALHAAILRWEDNQLQDVAEENSDSKDELL